MNKMRFGHPEISVCVWIVSIVPLLVILFLNPPLIVLVCIFASVFIGVFAITWLPYLISKYRLRPGLDKCKPGETTWCRVSKDRIILPQFVDKGSYGQTHGVNYGDKADVLDDGNFAVHWANGNPGLIVYDNMNVSVDLRRSVARKIMKKRYGVNSGVEAYNKWKDENKKKVSKRDGVVW